MKIKHYQGYGSVNAKKISKTIGENYLGEKMVTLVIKVWGNHECGILLDDLYDAWNWLVVKHFDKTQETIDYHKVEDWSTKWDEQKGEGGIDEEVVTYTFKYKK